MTTMIPPGHGEKAGPPAMPRCPSCATVIDTYLAAGTGDGKGRCPTHGLVVAKYGDRDAILAANDCSGCGRKLTVPGLGRLDNPTRWCWRCGGLAATC